MDIHEVLFLECGSDFLHESSLHSRHFSKYTYSLGVYDSHVGNRVSGCAVRSDERTQASWVDEGSGQDKRVLRIGEY